jgi:hypothetical protein
MAVMALSLNNELIEALRRQLEGISTSAVRTLSELVEGAVSEQVRLAAATKVLELVGVDRPKEVTVSIGEIKHVEDQTAIMLERLERNLEARDVKELTPALDTLFILEGSEDEPVVGGERIGGHLVIDVEEIP